MDAFALDPDVTRHLAEAVDASGRLRVMPASFYAGTTASERALLGHRLAAYVLPTVELVEHLRERIAGRACIEIGSGNGLLAEALGIPATDNRMQEWTDVAKVYATSGQPAIRYGANVEELDAHAAVTKYRPRVILGAWITHRYNPSAHELGGNVYGPDEIELVKQVDEYLFIGNFGTHHKKPLWKQHGIAAVDLPPFLYSRAMNGAPDFIASFTAFA